MRGPCSPYTILGLRPGADRAAVEEAYRRLMKLHHPDLPGGSAERAAELNRAYAALRGRVPPSPLPAVLQGSRTPSTRKRQSGRFAGMLMLAAAAGVLVLLPLPRHGADLSAISEPGTTSPQSAVPLSGTLDLHGVPDEDAIATAVAAASQLRGRGRVQDAVEFSRSCDEDLKTFPSPSLLDHCIAFDTASALMGGGNPNARFRSEDMAARHVGAALRVSADPVLAEERVGSVRRKVQQMLVRPEPYGSPADASLAVGAAGD